MQLKLCLANQTQNNHKSGPREGIVQPQINSLITPNDPLSSET
jgi:hypothetical protein